MKLHFDHTDADYIAVTGPSPERDRTYIIRSLSPASDDGDPMLLNLAGRYRSQYWSLKVWRGNSNSSGCSVPVLFNTLDDALAGAQKIEDGLSK
jgi:hypothetical protein